MNKLSTYWSSLRTSDVYFNISYALMMIMMALLPYTTFFMWPIGITLMVLWVCQWNWREKWENFKANDGIPYGVFLLCICLIPLLGFINSENKPIAWRSFEAHLWFFFAPLVFLTSSSKLWSKRHVQTLLFLFSVNEIIFLAFLFFHGIYKMCTTGDTSYMYNDLFCCERHHAYISLYANFVYLLIFQYLMKNINKISKKRKILLFGLELFISVCIFYAYSRAGILIFLFMHLVWCSYTIHLKRSSWKIMTALAISMFALFSTLIVTSPINRFTEEAIFFHRKPGDDREIDPRRIIWEASKEAAIDNLPWGVGTGDGNDIIVKYYHKNGYWLSSEHPFNAHNQFLFALLTNGIPGIIIILFFFCTPLGLAIRHKDILLLSLFLLMTLNCLVECMFDRRAGVDFFAVMIPLFIIRTHIYTQNNRTEPKNDTLIY